MKKILIFLMMIGILAGCAGCGGRQNQTSEHGNQQGESSDLNAVYVTESRYCNLKYPEKWKNEVDIAIEDGLDYAVEFTAKNGQIPLFDLVFGGNRGTLFGTLILDEENVVVRIVDYALDESSPDFQTLCMMQEDLNVVLQHLKEEYSVAVNEIVSRDHHSFMEIWTPLVTMYYPKKWENQVTVSASASGVGFSFGNLPLFDVSFGDGDGLLLGYYLGTPIRVTSYEIEKEAVTETVYHDFCAMQEDVNVIFQHLAEDPNFVINS